MAISVTNEQPFNMIISICRQCTLPWPKGREFGVDAMMVAIMASTYAPVRAVVRGPSWDRLVPML